MSAIFAFLHHLAAFAVVAAITVEFVLIRDELNARTVRRLAKLALFVLVALLSIYPTVKFFSWRQRAPDPAAVPAIRRILHLELAGVVLILLAAALMAKGVG